MEAELRGRKSASMAHSPCHNFARVDTWAEGGGCRSSTADERSGAHQCSIQSFRMAGMAPRRAR
eukprot:4954434-Prymnesium_polylepis.1